MRDKEYYDTDMIKSVSPSSYYSGKDFFQREKPPIEVLHIEHSLAYPSHSHGFTELVLIHSGKAKHHINSSSEQVKANDILIIPEEFTYSYSNVVNFSYINIIFDSDFIFESILNEKFFSDMKDIYRPLSPRKLILDTYMTRKAISIINKIDRELHSVQQIGSTLSICYFIQLLSLFYESMTSSFLEGISPEMRIRKVVEKIDNNISDDFSIDSLASIAIMSPRNFHRLFKDLLGKSPFVYIKEKRIEIASQLLVNTDLTITQIAALVGFDDPNYFSTLFKTLKGISPREFRHIL